MTENRALRYRKLAMAEQDPTAAKLLRQLADEAEQGVLCVADWHSHKGAPSTSIGTEPKS